MIIVIGWAMKMNTNGGVHECVRGRLTYVNLC